MTNTVTQAPSAADLIRETMALLETGEAHRVTPLTRTVYGKMVVATMYAKLRDALHAIEHQASPPA